MNTNTLNLQDKRRRRILLIVPFVVFCFTTILFKALGGGRNAEARAPKAKGLNMKLPSAIIAADESGDKLSFYDRAHADSLKKEQLRKSDPYTQKGTDSVNRLPGANGFSAFSPHPGGLVGADYGATSITPAENEARISQRLTQLQAVVNKPLAAIQPAKKPVTALPDSLLKPVAVTEDPELKQMNALLEKILDIQHPERLKAADSKTGNGVTVKKFRAIPAVIDGTQKIVQGTVICLKLSDTVTLSGQPYAKGQRLYGSGTLASQRYTLNIKSIHVGYNFFPVDLTVFDQTDGLEGISVPEAITGEALRDVANSGVSNMDIMSFDPSMAAQLTTAGVNTAKGIFGKKIRRVKGKLKDGHALLLRDNLEVKKND